MAASDPTPKPAMPPPPGQRSNFVDPPTLMPAVIITTTVALTLMTLCVSARAYVKTFIVRRHQIEDYLCYWAYAGVVTYTGILIYIEDYGFARHQWDLTADMFSHIMYYINILYCVYSPTTLPAKLSVLFQIKRIFTTPEKTSVFYVVWVSIIANAVFYTGLFFSYIFACWPREAIWNPDVKGVCMSSVSSNMAAGTINFISDLEALLLPAWAIWRLHMPVERKVAVFAVFGVGSIACVIGMVGIYFRVLLLTKPDFTWLCTKAALLVVSEMATVVMVGCFPSFPRLFHHIRGENSSSRQKSYESQNSDQQRYAKDKLGSMAKYMGPGGTTSVSNEHLELHTYDCELGPVAGTHGKGEEATMNGILKTTRVEQSVAEDEVVR